MIQIQIEEQTVQIAECTKDGDHLDLLMSVAQAFLDERVLLSQSPCPNCNLIILLEKHPATNVFSAETIEPREGWLGQ